MKLDIIIHLAARDTGTRLAPRRDMPKLGPYAVADISAELNAPNYRTVRRCEVRIGTSYAVDGRASSHEVVEMDRIMRGRVAEHIYGPVHAELRKHLYELMDEGIQVPALDRLHKMLKTFEDAFRGVPSCE